MQSNCYAKSMIRKKKSLEVGQVLLIIILVVIISITVGLSLVSRSITNLRTTSEEIESQKALSAAEAGIEQVLQRNLSTEDLSNITRTYLENGSNYDIKTTKVSGNTFLLNGGNTISKNEGVDVWFAPHNNDGTIDFSGDPDSRKPQVVNLFWGAEDEECGTSTPPAAIEVILISRNKLPPNAIATYRYAYDKCNRGNNFMSSDSGSFPIKGKTFTIRTGAEKVASNKVDLVFMRIIPLYANAIIGLQACNNDGNNCTQLPFQGSTIESIGKSGAAIRKFTVFKSFPQAYLPYISYGLFVPK